MRDHVMFYIDEQRVFGTTERISVQEIALKLIVAHFFVPDTEGGAWLVFDKESGDGVGIIAGPLKLCPRAARRMRHLPVALGYIPLALAPIVSEFGSAALLQRTVGVVPWRYLSGLHIRGYVRLDYAPFWYACGWLFESLERELRKLDRQARRSFRPTLRVADGGAERSPPIPAAVAALP